MFSNKMCNYANWIELGSDLNLWNSGNIIFVTNKK